MSRKNVPPVSIIPCAEKLKVFFFFLLLPEQFNNNTNKNEFHENDCIEFVMKSDVDCWDFCLHSGAFISQNLSLSFCAPLSHNKETNFDAFSVVCWCVCFFLLFCFR